MADHRDFLSGLSPDHKADLTRTSDWAGLIHLALHGGLIALFGTLIALQIPLWPLLLPVQGILIVFLFTLEHECTHRTPFRSPALSDWVGRVSGLLIFLPFEWFRYFHLAHHRFTNIPGQDPELEGTKPRTPGQWILHVSGLPLWRANLALILRLTTDRERAAYLPERALPRMNREARIMLGLYALAAMSLWWSPLLLWVWLLPIVIGQPFLRLYLLAEHGDCAFVANMFENTRTTFTNALIRFLAWNMPYHVEHHVFPAVPFHRLPDLHQLMRQNLKVTARGYTTFTRDYLARRLR
ncbi:fatty acid desaturase [Defluviimonas sp. WL0002]|uniref:Fatty acid desaturase n=1 Tax=Albidovulum marisflavi TaxID=2984159 RepID=A0ABT2ZBS6_9RHOB|nr:fatty acid desaturase [Defluviimonas sp. WL0002]MCV2868556.1 fatty acid desaturase [Defluviimonas sp. WL0002]